MGLQSHPCTPLSPRLPQLRPACPVAPQLHLSCTLPDTPSLPKVACNSRTGVTQQYEVIQTSNILRGIACETARHRTAPPEKSHVIPPGPHSPTAQKQRNINDPISKPETSSRELRAKLLGSGPCRPEAAAWPAGPGRGAGGRRQGQGGPRDRPLRAVRLACGDLAGGPPPTGTHSGHRHNRQRPGRLLHNSPHGSSPRRPRRICYDVRPVAPHACSYRLG